MKILIAGGSGFIGKRLGIILSEFFQLTLLTRNKSKISEGYTDVISWHELDESVIGNFDVVINLCGYNIASKKWTPSIKSKIIDSRIKPTQRLVELIGQKDIWLINASAIGFYAFSDQVQTEEDFITTEKSNDTFSQTITHQWEDVIKSSQIKKYTILRFGVVLGKSGGMLSKLILPTKLGLGMKIGNGSQLISWVHIDDVAYAILFIIKQNLTNQIFNITSPKPCTQKELIQTLAKSLQRLQVFTMPEVMVKLMFGQMGEELLLGSHNIQPKNLLSHDFVFNYSDIDLALYNSTKK